MQWDNFAWFFIGVLLATIIKGKSIKTILLLTIFLPCLAFTLVGYVMAEVFGAVCKWCADMEN